MYLQNYVTLKNRNNGWHSQQARATFSPPRNAVRLHNQGLVTLPQWQCVAIMSSAIIFETSGTKKQLLRHTTTSLPTPRHIKIQYTPINTRKLYNFHALASAAMRQCFCKSRHNIIYPKYTKIWHILVVSFATFLF